MAQPREQAGQPSSPALAAVRADPRQNPRDQGQRATGRTRPGPRGHLDTPPVGRPNQAGWYRNGPAPGAPGNAVLAGHADTRSGPAVFYRLGLLRLGDQIEVVREDRRTAVFTIDAVRTYPRAAFPDAEVYGPTERPELRVITCGGTYDKKSGYSNNVVVFAHLTSSR
ncbi:class F sortase [Kitasatospora gansuensis]